MRRGATLLAVCAGAAALFVSAAQAPKPALTYAGWVSLRGDLSCNKPPSLQAAMACIQLRQEIRAQGTTEWLVLKP